MKKFLLPIISLGFLCSCGDGEAVVHRPSYNLVMPIVERAPSLESLAVIALGVEGGVSGAVAACYGDTLPGDFIASRERFYDVVNKRLAGFRRGHFVELRTVLYETAAGVYATAGNVEAANGVRALLKRLSATLYIDGQRACDPPLKVRKRYEAAKAAAQRAYEQARL